MRDTSVAVRPANVTDIDALVTLRTANAEAHLALDPQAYRTPPHAAVIRHFTAAVTDGRDGVLVAHTRDGRVVGMVEVLRHPDPPEHQILRPEPSAQIHTVVLAEARGLGVGTALLDAAEAWAAGQGITYLSAGIHHRNAGAVRFYGRRGYTDAGVSLGLRPATSPDRSCPGGDSALPGTPPQGRR